MKTIISISEKDREEITYPCVMICGESILIATSETDGLVISDRSGVSLSYTDEDHEPDHWTSCGFSPIKEPVTIVFSNEKGASDEN
tara:strand:+ start:193 stop:450 length:258 start_codon:yes stop_codon:yes gene_type:complete